MDRLLPREQDALLGVVSGFVYQQPEAENLILKSQSWHSQALADFLERMSDERFPCLFARKAWKDRSLRLLFCAKRETGQYEDFLHGLIQYTQFVRDTDVSDRLFFPLVVFFDERFCGEERLQHLIAWEALEWGHEHDPSPWPADVPLDTDDPKWSFCFNGVQLFININSTNHRIIKSRNLGRFLTMVINPRENFDIVANSKTKSGKLIRNKIRERVAAFNDGYVPQELGFYGDRTNKEWHQYQLSEAGLERPSVCPFLKSRR